ncbi:MAG TPA: hypothetical protein PKY59_02530 [Pyrinomonadaceae bacterium]|nr:hypothetical protein [Pyrinomonadaceae bacterium]
MVRIVLAVIAGFFIWAFLWVGSDAVLRMLSPGWYGKNFAEFQTAIDNKTTFALDSSLLLISLVRSAIFSVIAGFIAVLISKENFKTPIGLGILLLVFGSLVQSVYWNYLPIWYHILFLGLLIPMTILGGKLKNRQI